MKETIIDVVKCILRCANLIFWVAIQLWIVSKSLWFAILVPIVATIIVLIDECIDYKLTINK